MSKKPLLPPLFRFCLTFSHAKKSLCWARRVHTEVTTLPLLPSHILSFLHISSPSSTPRSPHSLSFHSYAPPTCTIPRCDRPSSLRRPRGDVLWPRPASCFPVSACVFITRSSGENLCAGGEGGKGGTRAKGCYFTTRHGLCAILSGRMRRGKVMGEEQVGGRREVGEGRGLVCTTNSILQVGSWQGKTRFSRDSGFSPACLLRQL